MDIRRWFLVNCLVLAAWLGSAGCTPPSAGQTGLPVERSADGSHEAASSPPDSPNGARSAAIAPRQPDASDLFFEKGGVARLEIDVAPDDVARLDENPRTYVRCRIHERGAAGQRGEGGEEGATWEGVGIKLKGAAGSFQGFHDKPALTLNVGKFRKKGEPKHPFHGLEKFHLNNSVQDETYLNELLCSELFRAAGVAAPRVAHARVRLNGRDVGLYVLKEGFDATFLARHFSSGAGNLYDGGFCQEIDQELELDSGPGPDDRRDLRALCEACREQDPAERAKQLAVRLDVDAFLTFAALELMTGHWDGYCLARNNYRVYFEPGSGKAYFLPHGMDQMFGDPGASILDWPPALVASAVMQNPDWRSHYRERIRTLLPRFSPPDALLERVDTVTARLRPVLEQIDPQLAHDHADRVRDLKERLVARAQDLEEQSRQPDPEPPQPPEPLAFNKMGAAELADWGPASETDEVMHEEIELPDNGKAYSISARDGVLCIASWRRRVLLEPGKYRFVAKVRTTDVAAHEDEKGSGAGLRISGAARGQGLAGTTDWQEIEYEFEVTDEPREVELVAELRAICGQAMFDASSLRLLRESAE